MTNIDFVVAWVDGSDPAWQQKKAKALGAPETDDRIQRYRDWDILRYWFRAAESFTPWVNNIFFICDQDPPKWLNQSHPKLKIIRHEDYIPQEYFPTFSSHTIELNIHRIQGLSEQFVYFNDDMHIIRPLKPDFFFKKGLPRDSALLNPIPNTELRKQEGRIFTVPLNNTEYLNRDYIFRDCVKKHPMKWLTLRYGKSAFRNFFLMVWPRFVGFDELHLPQAFLKASLEKAWEQDRDILDETCHHPIRSDRDVNHWLVRYRQLAEGTFLPRKPIKNAVFQLEDQTTPWLDMIRKQEKPMICLNDGPLTGGQFEQVKQNLQEAFRSILPEKSAFEI